MFIINSYFIILIIILFIIYNSQKKRKVYVKQLIKKKKRGERRKMPTELIKDFIGKNCSFSMIDSSFGFTGVIQEIQDNWLKVETNGKIKKLINADMIVGITELPEKNKKTK